VPVTGAVPLNMANPISAVLDNDVTVNCDMMQVDQQGNTIKAIAYGRRYFWGAPSLAPEAHIYCADWAGNNLTINLPIDADKPDVAIGDTVDNNGTVAYRVAVVYQVNYDVFVDVWQLDNAGTPAFSATNVLSMKQMNKSGYYADTFHTDPHIDMWSDAVNLNPATGLPTMHQFAVIWSQDPALWPYSPPHGTDIDASELNYLVGDINNPAGSFNGASGISLGNTAYMPDVACLTDVRSGDQKMEITFTVPFSPPLGSQVFQTEFNYTLNGGSSTPSPITAPPTASMLGLGHFSPRIEAMSQYDPGAGIVQWQIAVTGGTFAVPPPGAGTCSHVLGYNSAGVVDDLSGSSWILPGEDAKSPCVAAGVSPSFSSDLGNQQYTASFHPWRLSNFYERSIDPFTGLTDVRWWEVVDSTANPDTYHWDVSRSTAISNCSNSGLNLLTAWYDGTNIVYKESPNSMVFKTSPTVVHTPAGGSGFQAWPNPATDVLYLKGPQAGHYSLTDMAGKVLLQGACKAEAMVSLRGLANGLYLLSYKDAQGKTENLKIVKQ
jgi:hypothetical protein